MFKSKSSITAFTLESSAFKSKSSRFEFDSKNMDISLIHVCSRSWVLHFGDYQWTLGKPGNFFWPQKTKLVNYYYTTTVLRPFFQDYPGEPVPEENFWTLWCKVNSRSGYGHDDNTIVALLLSHFAWGIASRGEMNISHSRLCVCLSLTAFPHYCMDLDVTWGMVRGAL